MPDLKKNFGLTEKKFDELLLTLQAGDESLIRVIYTTHFERCRTFLIFKMKADFDTAYDITKDTLLKFRKNLLAGKIKYGNLSALFTIDAKNNYLKWVQKRKRIPEVEIDDATLKIPDAAEKYRYDDDTILALKKALKKLGNDCMDLISWHYYLGLSQKEIADKRSMRGDDQFVTASSVKTKLASCRKKLKEYI